MGPQKGVCGSGAQMSQRPGLSSDPGLSATWGLSQAALHHGPGGPALGSTPAPAQAAGTLLGQVPLPAVLASHPRVPASPGSSIRLPARPACHTSWWLRCFLVQDKEPDWRSLKDPSRAGGPGIRKARMASLQLEAPALPQRPWRRMQGSGWDTFPTSCLWAKPHVLLVPEADKPAGQGRAEPQAQVRAVPVHTNPLLRGHTI